MNEQDPLFHEDWRDALRHAVKALGGYDAVGIEIWPAKLRKAAGAWLSDCLNPERPAKLDLEEIEQIILMARRAGIHCAMHVLADRTEYERPSIKEPPTPSQKLAEQMEFHSRALARLADEHAAVVRAGVVAARVKIRSIS